MFFSKMPKGVCCYSPAQLEAVTCCLFNLSSPSLDINKQTSELLLPTLFARNIFFFFYEVLE